LNIKTVLHHSLLSVFILILTIAIGATMQSQRSHALELGFNLVSWDNTGAVNIDTWENAVQEMYNAGVRSFAIVTYRFVDKNTGKIYVTSKYGLASPPEDSLIVAAMKKGQELGMQVSLNPFIEIDNPSGIGHIWRGTLDFVQKDLQTFFDQYTNYIRRMAKLAALAGAERIYIGSELKKLCRNKKARELWLDLISVARHAFGNDGLLTYAANHDNYHHVSFWKQLDEIGIDAYFSLATRLQAKGVGNPSMDVVIANWRQLLESLKNFSEKLERPVILSEWGVVPIDLTTYEPWNWKPSEIDDVTEQLNAYRATINVVTSQENWIRGIYFWHWGMKGNLESNYSITRNSAVGQFITNYFMEKGH